MNTLKSVLFYEISKFLDKDGVVYIYTHTHTHTHTHIYIYIMKYYTAIKKNKIMPLAAIWVDLQIVILSEMST